MPHGEENRLTTHSVGLNSQMVPKIKIKTKITALNQTEQNTNILKQQTASSETKLWNAQNESIYREPQERSGEAEVFVLVKWLF